MPTTRPIIAITIAAMLIPHNAEEFTIQICIRFVDLN
jgi:hypothetical protein